jgi:hypothetical protein
MAAASLAKVGLALLAVPAVCSTLCALRVPPIHDWMMRHDCPIAKMTMTPPSRPVPTSMSTPMPMAFDDAWCALDRLLPGRRTDD